MGAGLARALTDRLGDGASFCGVGGPHMAAHGVVSPFDIRELSIVGYVEALKAYRRVVRRADETVALAVAEQPDVAILIDAWGFTVRVAQRLRAALPDLPIVKYAGPQVWATRPSRAATLAATVDRVLTLQPFEPAYFERAGLAAEFVGHPVFEKLPQGDGAGFRARYKIPPDAPVALVLFGSRASEARRLTPAFADAVERLDARFGDRLHVVAPLAESIATQMRAAAADDPRLQRALFVDEPERDDAFAAANVALACSGTVTTELAIAGVPAVVAYRFDTITYVLARHFYKAPHISLINMAADERIMPEFLQNEATGEALANAVACLIEEPDYAASVRAKLADAVAKMRGDGPPASERAADAVLRELHVRRAKHTPAAD